MKTIKLAIAGYGNVTKALLRLLDRKQAELETEHHLRVLISGVSSGRHGFCVAPDGISPTAFVEYLTDPHALATLSQTPVSSTPEMIAKSGADVFIENSPVNYATGQPAASYIKAAFAAGMHVITANKGPIAAAYPDLRHHAELAGKHLLFESTVMDGAPIFSLFRSALPGARLLAFTAILNSTTNLILSLMEDGNTFDQAVHIAQQAGLAETDPSGDIDGWDAAVKVTALARVLMKSDLKVEEVDRQGIRGVTPALIAEAKAQGMRYKLICEARVIDGKVTGSVRPKLVNASSPFYAVDGSTSIISFETDTLTKLTLIEHDPTPETTAYGELADLLTIYQK